MNVDLRTSWRERLVQCLMRRSSLLWASTLNGVRHFVNGKYDAPSRSLRRRTYSADLSPSFVTGPTNLKVLSMPRCN